MVGRDVQVVRNIVVLVFTVNVLLYAIFRISQHALEEGRVVNVFSTSPAVFDRSVDTVVLGGLLIVLELMLIIGVLEVAKSHIGTASMVPVYVLSYVGALVLDGVLFPAIVLRPDADLGGLIHDQVVAKLVLAASFAVPLLLFVLAYRPAVRGFEEHHLQLRQVLHVTRDELVERIDAQQAELDAERDRLHRTRRDAVHASATVSSILDAATDTLLVALDPDLAVTAFNVGAERLLDRPRDGVLGTSPETFHTTSEIARHAAELGVDADYASVLRAQVASGSRRDWELVVGEDERVVLSLSITEIDVDGRLAGYVIAGVDVTDRYRTELALQAALEHAREADGFKRSVVSTVSHELRTPIASILGYTELMAEGDFGDLNPAQDQAVGKVRSNASRLGRIVDDLLTLDRVEEVPAGPALEVLDLREVVTSGLDGVRELVQSGGHELVVDLPDVAVPVLGEQMGLQRVLVNLVGNAVKFTPDAGTITVVVRRTPEGDAQLVVADTGIGVAEHDRDRLFERFYRSPEANSRAIPGSGLGLSIVQAVVAEHDGRVTADAAPGGGTVMSVTLPTAEA